MRRSLALTLALVSALSLVWTGTAALAQDRSRADMVRERLKTRPNDPTLYFYLAYFEIEDGHKEAGIAALREVARLGRGFLPSRGGGFEPAWNDTAFQNTLAQLEAKLPRVTEARTLFRLDKNLIPEGISYDPKQAAWYVGSIATGKIVRVDSAGSVTDFAPPSERKPILGLAIDAGRRRLHAVRTNGFLTPGPGSQRVNEILSYDLQSKALARTVAVPGAVQLNDIVVAANGDLYASDTQGASVYRIREAGGVVDSIAGALPGANGIALSADGGALYVAHSSGIARIRLADGNILSRIAVPDGETIAAIDGLYRDGAVLLGIQNVTNPGRVIRIHLAANGDGVERVETLLSHHHPAIDEPTTGVVVGRTFALLATTQVTRYTPEGKIASPETLKPPVVLSIDLDRGVK
jgi:sugar lactone lactonase YvrE